MDIVIVAQYLCDLDNLDKSNGRFVYLGGLLSQHNDVEIVTSTFIHGKKLQAVNPPKEYNGCVITPIYEKGYPKNVCLSRFSSHRGLANRIKGYLDNRKKPDVIYAAVPSLAVAEVCADYCKKNKVRFIVDIQDLWPEAFKMVLNIPIISDLAFLPMKLQADKIYSTADEIIAVSDAYAERGMKVNRRRPKSTTVYLGTEKKSFDEFAQKEKIGSHDKIRLVYVGTLGSSYDLSVVFKALRLLEKSELENIEFVVMGDGPLKQKFENSASGLPVVFTGALPYSDMVSRMVNCDIAVNPIVKGAAQSIINKHMDYAMAGLPVISTQECVEYRKLLEEYAAGINCACEDEKSVANALHMLISDPNVRKEMGQNSRKMGAELFDRSESYQKIVNLINN